MFVSPGHMRHKIVIEQATDTQGGGGAISQTWATFKTLYAQRIDTGGIESLFGRQISSEITVVWRCMYVEGITAKMRILYDSNYYNIVAVNEHGRQYLEIMTKRQGA